jgi:glycopeptide antibiotics resistance protein
MNPPIKNRALRTFASLLFVAHIFIVIKFVLLKNPGELKSHFINEYSTELLQQNISDGNYIPFYTVPFYVSGIDKLRYTKENLVGNIVLFFPFGILLPLLFKNISSFRKVFAITFAISLCLELIQLFAILGNFDVDDLLLNLLGASLGFGTYILIKELRILQRAQISE